MGEEKGGGGGMTRTVAGPDYPVSGAVKPGGRIYSPRHKVHMLPVLHAPLPPENPAGTSLCCRCGRILWNLFFSMQNGIIFVVKLHDLNIVRTWIKIYGGQNACYFNRFFQ